jgi:hypothetical protein
MGERSEWHVRPGDTASLACKLDNGKVRLMISSQEQGWTEGTEIPLSWITLGPKEVDILIQHLTSLRREMPDDV